MEGKVMGFGHDLLYIVIGLIPGLVLGFLLARMWMKKYLKKINVKKQLVLMNVLE